MREKLPTTGCDYSPSRNKSHAGTAPRGYCLSCSPTSLTRLNGPVGDVPNVRSSRFIRFCIWKGKVGALQKCIDRKSRDAVSEEQCQMDAQKNCRKAHPPFPDAAFLGILNWRGKTKSYRMMRRFDMGLLKGYCWTKGQILSICRAVCLA